jgi:hypothetical protein
MSDVSERLEEVKRLVGEGKLVIENDAASLGNEAVVVEVIATGGLYVQWSRRGIGFGTLTLHAENGKLMADTECMSDEFILGVLAQALRERRGRIVF